MRDIDQAIDDISEIRTRLALSTRFDGIGPAAVAATSGIAALALALQVTWRDALAADMARYFTVWIAVGLVCALILAGGMVLRAYEKHGRQAVRMCLAIIGHFVPTAVAGAAIFAAIAQAAPASLWLVPGLWQILLAVGVLSAPKSLPPALSIAGYWYLLSGFAVILASADLATVSPWAMGVPFAIGQALATIALFREELRQ